MSGRSGAGPRTCLIILGHAGQQIEKQARVEAVCACKFSAFNPIPTRLVHAPVNRDSLGVFVDAIVNSRREVWAALIPVHQNDAVYIADEINPAFTPIRLQNWTHGIRVESAFYLAR